MDERSREKVNGVSLNIFILQEPLAGRQVARVINIICRSQIN